MSVSPLVIGMVANVVNVETVHEAIGTIVDSQTQQAHVVGVHHTMTKPHCLPLGRHARSARDDHAQPLNQASVETGFSVAQVNVETVHEAAFGP